jgi:protein-L-isoaspartate(D-aspartate) O-methyltransferase
MKQLSSSTSLEKMIRQQLIERGIHDKAVLEAIRKVPREQFFPQDMREHAHADKAAPIGHGQTISQPYMVALMTQKLALKREHRVLEIGTGSGYQTAILANLTAEVYTVERVKPLLDDAFERLMSLGYRNVHLHYGDGTLGWEKHAPYDRIIITAGAPEMPRALLQSQLKDDGIAVLPVGPEDEQMLVEVQRSGRRLETKEICACRFVKLIGEGGWKEE